MCYPLKVLCSRYNVFAGTETLSNSVYDPITIHMLLGGPSRNLGDVVELERRVCYPLKVLCSRYNVLAGTETLSLSVYEPIAMQFFVGGPSPIIGMGLSWGVDCGTA